MRPPRTFTFHIFSANRVSSPTGLSNDYYVTLPQLDALVNGGDRPDYYEMWLDKICGTAVLDPNNTLGNTGAQAVDAAPEAATIITGFIQVALDLPAPYLISNGKPNVKFIAPITGATMQQQSAEGRSNSSSPVLISASGMNSTLHVQLYDQAGAVLNTTGHEHVIVLTLREARA